MPLLPIPHPSLPPSTPSYPQAYSSILLRSRRALARGQGGGGGLVIMVANDLDGVCAARMWTTLLTGDDIPHKVFPVEGYADLEARTQALEGDPELHTLLLLSLGSLLPLSSHFLTRLTPTPLPAHHQPVHIHVLDAHRPWNLENLFGGERERVWVWGDDGLNDDDEDEGALAGKKRLGKEREAFEALEYEPDSDSDSDDSDDDLPSDESSSEEDITDASDGSEDEDGERKPKRRRKVDESGNLKPLSKRRRRAYGFVINRYYQAGTHFGLSVAGTVYLLATALGREDNDLLWLAILGLTHQYIATRIDRDRYEHLQGLYLDEVARLNPSSLTADPSSTTVSSSSPDDHALKGSEELRFTMYRHWNLYESMAHSGYVASKMGIWREKGRGRLHGMLAKMGFSLTQCHQSYSNMSLKLKRELFNKMDSIAPEYGLVELTYPSFTRTYGFRSLPLSAADAVEGVSSLLEAAEGVRIEVEIEGSKGGGEWFGGARLWAMGDTVVGPAKTQEGNADDGEDGAAEVDERAWEGCFWSAFDAVRIGGDASLLHASLPLCMALQKAIIRQGSALIDKGKIAPLKWFRLAAITEGPDLALFVNPSTLSRLALWLVDALRDRLVGALNAKQQAGGEERRRTRSLPIVVACLDERRGTYVVVGVTGAPEYGDVRKNKFGLAFQDAASESNAGTKHDRFDTSVVEVKKEDLSGFVEALATYATERMG